MFKYFYLLFFVFISTLLAQLDTVKGDWPFPPFKTSHGINATFGEFRNTLSSDHFHNAVDIGEADGNPCYSSLDGVVKSLERNGSNAFVRIASHVGSKWKQITYLHIAPSPSISVGDAVKAGETIIGTVVNGMGHVHLIERELSSNSTSLEVPINNLRKNGGLTPFVDTWAPKINSSSLKFFINNSKSKLSASKLYGKVDIQIKIEEVNGTGGGQTNNGTYIAGYRIWNEAKAEIVYEPNDNGVKYRFDRKPLDSYVHNAFVENLATLSNPVYWLTNGDGADAINNSRKVSDNYFDASALPKGNYQLEIFAEDTRDNKTNMFFPITILDPKPQMPLLYGLFNSDNKRGVTAKWKSNSESDIIGYRLYYSANSELTDWQLVADESQLTNKINSFTINSPTEYKVPSSNPVSFYRLTAVDIAGQESEMTDIFARSDFIDGSGMPKALIVNAFHTNDFENEIVHNNCVPIYFNTLSTTSPIVISSISNKYFLDNIAGCNLEDYNLVVWYTGDSRNHKSTIQLKEMAQLASYLEQGGNLFISGAKIGHDLDDQAEESTDTLFYYQYLKAKFVYLGDDTMIPATGVENTLFSGVVLNYGEVTEEKYPDDINPIYGSEVLFNYNATREDGEYRHAAIGYKGKFGNGTIDGGLFYLSFPLETVRSLTDRQKFFKLMLQYLGITTDIKDEITTMPSKFSLEQNYPNPFNPSTTIKYLVPNLSAPNSTINVVLKVYDILGREVQTLVNKEQKPGSYEVTFDASKLTSGVYFAKIRSGNFTKTISMMLIK